MKLHQILVVVIVLLIGYFIGTKYPGLIPKVG